MGEFTKRSQIEFMRRRRHGAESRIRFLRDDVNGYLIIGELVTHFLVSRKWDTMIGARVETLVFDHVDDFNTGVLDDSIFADLVKPTGVVKRYRVSSLTEPSSNENRWRLGITANFNDTTLIYGISAPEPPEQPPQDLLFRYVHTQTVPATEWIVNHNLGERPTIMVSLPDGSIGIADARHITINQARIYFAVPTAGEARCV